MKNQIYKQIEITGTSSISIENAVETSIKRAHKTIKNLCWFEVMETRGHINKGKLEYWKVTIKIGFAVND